MLWKRISPIFLLVLAAAVLVGCAGQRDSANPANVNAAAEANANTAIEPNMEGAKDNAEELAAHVKMPFEPEDLVWKEYLRPEGNRLVAVFQLTDADSRRLIDSASKIRPGMPVSINSENWFPKELTTQNELRGDSGIQATAYAADDFYQPPYSEGTFSRVDNTNFFVLELFAK